MKPDPKSPLSPEEFAHLRGDYPTLDTLVRAGHPLTRANYIRAAWAAEPQDENDAEFQQQLPPPFRTW